MVMRNPRDDECEVLMKYGFEVEDVLWHWVKRDMPGVLAVAEIDASGYGWELSVYCVNTNRKLYAAVGFTIGRVWTDFLFGN